MASLKMQATANAKGFTLVELIVVITILAILGTIGFISLQGYSAQSRDSKRTSDLRSLSTAVTTKSTEGLSLLSFISGTSSRVTGTWTIAGTGATVATEYEAGIPNSTVLWINAANFNDPNTSAPYKIGASTKAGWVFQIAARLEGGGTATPAVTGNYNARTAQSFAGAGPTGQKNFTITNSAAVGLFKRGDTVHVTGATPTTNTVTNVSGDGLTVTLANDIAGAAGTAIAVGQAAGGTAEVLGLIASTTTTTPVTATGTALPY